MNIKRMVLIPLTAGVLTLTIAGCSPKTEEVPEQQVVQDEEMVALDKKVNYARTVIATLPPLETAYSELSNLLIESNTIDPDWVSFYRKHSRNLESGYTELLALETPQQYEEQHDKLLTALEQSLSVNDDIGESVDIGESLSVEIVDRFTRTYADYEEVIEDTEELEDFIENAYK